MSVRMTAIGRRRWRFGGTLGGDGVVGGGFGGAAVVVDYAELDDGWGVYWSSVGWR